MSGLPIDPADTRFRPGVQTMVRVHSELNAMGRAYARERLPARLAAHVVTMDSVLAAHLNANPGS